MLIVLIVGLMAATTFAQFPDTLWTQTFGGGSDDPGVNLPLKFEFSQNYPNPFNPTPTKAQKLAGQYGLSLQTGFLIANKLCIEDLSYSQSGCGIPYGGGLYYFISENVMGSIDLVFIPFPEWMHLWGAHRTWSILELGAHAKYINTISSKISLYGKFGLKMARLSGSCRPGKGLLGGSVGSSLKTKTAFAPGGELGLGLMGNPSKNVILLGEVVFSYLLMKGKDVRVNGEAAAWKYPFNLDMYGVRVGLIIPIGGKGEKP